MHVQPFLKCDNVHNITDNVHNVTDDDNRVILTPMEDLSNDYINASYVDVSISCLQVLF